MGEFAGPRSPRPLLDAVLTVGSDLAAMLERIVQAAVDLVDARYGALGVLDDTRERLAQFITVGVDDKTRADQPRGRGLDNMAARAGRRGGSFDIGPATSNGTVVEWRLPIG
jgi:signal transduction histidine kinase